jgi:hypothetical protein
MKALFGPSISKNEYRYCHKNDEELIVHVETLWMAMHQKTQVLHTHMINKEKARGIVFEQKSNQVNWCVFIKWTIYDQLQ